ncbi:MULTISPECIES: DUF1707 SHOCT-like domain-containing protein [Nocardiaceae]|uniref:DUF1707 SHOCT-like domain-containing protein n=1 Tax=Nocardiaceae TaxID=85025 RepID=UPI001F5EA7B8|nr:MULTISPECIES: DUF1707 domain-containing protein [Rhodococcus]
MPTRLPPTTRARDVDRSNTCATLDEALADGQLSDFEHAARIDLAKEAETIADLHTLIEDLQNDTDLQPMADPIELKHPIATAKGSRLGFMTVAVPAVAALVALTFGIRACSSTEDPASSLGTAGYKNPAVVAAIVDALQQKIGTSVVDRLGLYDDYAVIAAPAPGLPQKQVSYTYRDGVIDDYDDNFSSTRDFDEPQIDLATIDLTTTAGIIAGASESLNMSRIDSYSVSFYGSDNGPEIYVSAENTDKESGNLAFDPAGNFLRVTPFSFG